jgi:hypothetical protein
MKSMLLIVIAVFCLLEKVFSVCNSGQSVCAAGTSGLGGCYLNGYKCDQGLICSATQSVCLKGISGPGGCYQNGYTCKQGLIYYDANKPYCPPGSSGLGGYY